MSPSPKSRAPLAAAAGLATCVGLGCASAPRTAVDPPPPLIPCPAGAAQTYRAHRLTDVAELLLLAREPDAGVTVRHGAPVRAEVILGWGDLPDGTFLLGRTWFGRDRVYGRLTELLLPSGERLPICLELSWNGPGVPMRPGHTRTTARIEASVGGRVVPESMSP